MPAQLINGNQLADKILLHIKTQAALLDPKPGLAAILIGDNEASKLYIKLKEKACLKIGINFHSYQLSKNCLEKQVVEIIDFLNNDPEVTGIIVQLPLPKNFNTDNIIKAIDPNKDIDGFHPQTKVVSPNILGIVELIKATGEDLKGKNVSVLSNSEIFAKPFKKLLPNCEVKYLNPKTAIRHLQSAIKQSDILIVAIGKPKFIKPDMIKKGAILIDVGINKVGGKIVGDIDPTCDKIAAFRSPVPGGVGPMTVAMLLTNLVNMVK